MNYFDNFKKSVEDENSFIGQLMVLASDVRLKIFADDFSFLENRCCLNAFDIQKNSRKVQRSDKVGHVYE